ncbi:TPA: DNA-binding protein, partial [Neisseria meningitidis]
YCKKCLAKRRKWRTFRYMELHDRQEMPSERIFRSVLRLVGVSSETVKQKFAGVELSYAGKAAGESLYCL